MVKKERVHPILIMLGVADKGRVDPDMDPPSRKKSGSESDRQETTGFDPRRHLDLDQQLCL